MSGRASLRGAAVAFAAVVVAASTVTPHNTASAAATNTPESVELTPKDFAYRMRVIGTGNAAAYRLTLPLAIYQKIAHPDLADLRVFNGKDEPVPFAIERPVAVTVAGAVKTFPVFPLKGDSNAALDALRVTIESGSGAIDVHAGGSSVPSDRIGAYLVDARSLDAPISALDLEWPDDAPDFAGRIKVEASDNLSDWRLAAAAAPIANLHSTTDRLVEQRVELARMQAKYWRLSWVGSNAPFALTSVLAEPSKQNVDARHASLSVPALPVSTAPGEFEFDLGASVPADRVNLQLPETNTVVEVELLSRAKAPDPWRLIRRAGFYRLQSDGAELRNGPVTLDMNTDRHWLVHADRKGGGLGSGAPQLVVDWVPHELVFVARGMPPFFIAYGSVAAQSTAVSLAAIPKLFSIAAASVGDAEEEGGEARLRPPPTAYPWKNGLLWAILLVAAALLGWMALRLSREFR
jgi:Protein of unknown function (DUF3999)